MGGNVTVDLPGKPGGRDTRTLIPYVHPANHKSLVFGKYQGDLPSIVLKLDPSHKLTYPQLLSACRAEISRLLGERQKIEKKLEPLEKAITKEGKKIEAAKKLKDAGERVRVTLECEKVIDRLKAEKEGKESASSSYVPLINDLEKFLREDPVLVQYQRVYAEAQRQRVFWAEWESKAEDMLAYRQAVIDNPDTQPPAWFTEAVKAGPEKLFNAPEIDQGPSGVTKDSMLVNGLYVDPKTGAMPASEMFQHTPKPPLVEGDEVFKS